jgi:hypothetical protein
MVAKPFSTLPKTVKSLQNKINKGLERVIRATTDKTLETAIRTTRVDTGLARSNWQVTKAAPANNVIPPYKRSSRAGRGETANLKGALNAGRRVIRTFSIKTDVTLFIANNVNYIETLNDKGAGSNPPDFMRQKAVLVGRQTALKEFRNILKGR